ncbi:MAG: phosphoribosyl-ATP diphosphatase [Spirochaetaceae bacterium]|jgi:phosphoribosyl-ATP pyrophosphohydrolase/phosphoribosyl-AMP cyclohydrolase|nr:phosphoribosyl-ATP diphosphatase [Spirochaetaceae bacterium]
MVIASIDIQGAKVVQLRQGSELVLQYDDAAALIKEFDRYGEVAVIDLDAAQGGADNTALIKSLLRQAQCRVGGGIRTVSQACELLSWGAQKIIIGSRAFRDSVTGRFKLNTEFLADLAEKIGRERLIIALDSRGEDIVIDGWKTVTTLPLIETAQEAAHFAGELLWTCVEREGTMTGIDMALALRLRTALECRLTVAGGVASLAEIEQLAALGCDVQLGMALYTGAVSLADAFVCCLNWNKAPLLPVIAQSPDGQVLMTGFADKEAVSATFKLGKLCFHSRSRDSLWMKGEKSGNTLDLIRLHADCDRDALLATVSPTGPVCHTGAYSCFVTSRRYTLEYLQEIIAERFRTSPSDSYTATLNDERVRRKLMEEAYELCTASTHDEQVWEAADLFFFATALITRAGITVEEVLNELARRHK